MSIRKSSTGARIFLVDDNILVLKSLSALIESEPDLLICGLARTARETLDSIAIANPHIAIVDISLPDASGIELIPKLLQILPTVKILVVSMHENPFYIQPALAAGARAFIAKKDAAHQVVPAIRELLRKK